MLLINSIYEYFIYTRKPAKIMNMKIILFIIHFTAMSLFSISLNAQTITTNQVINFGILEIPNDSLKYYDVLADGTHGGSAILIGGTPAPYNFTITGTGVKTINISVAAGIVPTGTSWGPFVASYDGAPITLPASGLANPGAGGKTLIIGARYRIATTASEATPGAPAMTLTVNYDP